MEYKQFLTTQELADILGISRIAVFKKIKNGQIKAKKIGRNYLIEKKDITSLKNKEVHKGYEKDIEEEIKKGVTKVIEEYSETLKKLGSE